MTKRKPGTQVRADGAGSENEGGQFDRLPLTDVERTDPGRATRTEVLDWWEGRFGIAPDTFDGVTFWEKGAGKIWALGYDLPGPLEIETLGLPILRTRQEYWKPTTDGVQRFGTGATMNVVELDEDEARRFLAGETQGLEWDGDWGYLIGARWTAGDLAPIGVGLYTYGEFKSMVPKGRRRQW